MEGGPPIFRQDGSCPALLEDRAPGFPYGAVTRSGSSFQTLLVPQCATAGLVRFRSPLLAESRLMSVPPATEMFQFAGFASRTYEFSTGYRRTSLRWVAPFGDPGITDRSHLPRAFRSVPRPSSPLSAKASTRCPFLTRDRSGPGAPTGPPTLADHHRAQRQTPARGPFPMKTLCRDTYRAALPRRRRPASVTFTNSASPFNQPPRRTAAAAYTARRHPRETCSSPNAALTEELRAQKLPGRARPSSDQWR